MIKRAVLALLLCLCAGFAAAQAPPRLDFEALRQEVNQIESQLARNTQSDGELATLRGRIDPVIKTINEILARESPRLEEVNARLAEIGPKPDAKAPPESAEISRNREEQERLKKEVDETIRVTRLLLVRAEQIVNGIADRRRTLFKQAVLERTHSVASPWLWIEIVRVLPGTVDDLRAFFSFRIKRAYDRVDPARLTASAGLVLLLVAAWIPARRFQRRLMKRPAIDEPTRLNKTIHALKHVVLAAALAGGYCLVLFSAIDLLDISADRLGELLRALLILVPALAFLRGLAFAILTPDDARWRIPTMSDQAARRLFDLVRALIWIVIAGKAVEAVNQAIFAALPVTIATRGLVALAVSGVTLGALRRIESGEEALAESDDLAAARRPAALFARSSAFAAALVIALAALFGYVALASFLIDQAVWIVVIGCCLAILLGLGDELAGKGLSGGSQLGRNLKAATGLSTGSLQQIGILSSGLLRLVLIAGAVLLALAPWGVDSVDLLSSIRAAFFGFQVGGVTVSLATIASALALFLAGFFVTRGIQRWLDGTYLPSTGLDLGLRNSIRTIFGYVGILIAAVIGLGQLGLSLDKVTIVAGALSVGIGFGLQSIVNNFVSGLILLWERPIRVGDWIVVGEEQGKVRRINVRATEIETFDKASLIVPNSEFISGRVKNWMHSDRMGRIILPVGVSYGAEPERVKALLLDVALAHREVMSEPPPRVFFMKLGESSLDFELRCFVDVDAMLPTRSELLFGILRRLKQEGIDVPFPRRTVEIADMDRLGRAIAEHIPPGKN